ncbi:vanin-like protein 2 [Chironomus tepperi]|uniref:vanin-like protein 2 n=1 Tax=Chironomus tepperi TaxID=113505 RepID=UPI00391FC01F
MMKILILKSLIFFANFLVSLSDNNVSENILNASENYYTAAVLEFNSPGNRFSSAEQIVDVNLKEYIKWIYIAKEYNVDILVFPEATLNYHGLLGDDLKKFAIPLPQETSDNEYEYNCDYSSNTILNELSDAVGNVSIYVLVNIVEIEECNESTSNANNFSLYNTNIVFDRSGCIVSRYRKFNLFIEPDMSVPEDVNLPTFETDFGVTFGHFICFDILFKFPAYDLVLSNISHIIYPSMWYSEVPFLTSVQLQQNYAYRNNIVLLSSGANFPSNSKTGSGIFIGKYGPADSIISYRDETKIIVAKIPKDLNDDSIIPDNPTIKPYTPIEMDRLKTWSFTPQNIYPLQDNFHLKNGEVECKFVLNFTDISLNDSESIGYTYKFAVFSGKRNLANIVNAGEMYCSIIPCLNDDLKTCGYKLKDSRKLVPSTVFHSISITMTVSNIGKDDCLIMPTSLDFSILPLNIDSFRFTEINQHAFKIEASKNLSNILTFGIYGRNFSLDEKIVTKSEPKNSLPIIESENFDDLKLNKNLETKKFQNYIDIDDNNIGWKLTIYAGLMVILSIIAAILVYRRLQHPYEHPLIIMRRKSEMNTS